ncbi:2-hydroxymuconic semialdehyde dehydrogenase [Sphingomonas sp. Root710]|uniref:2-hydroxymuconic semialdehyde dehydrogenase n=1 Tax=Sphingomonas sp. Root710 TaxID=1736594 RepID=UPI0006F6432D|nr:2-hydroxymuconic semialdehyde dehydrogenase [Sphingomonas sp. Root710]KRB78902.1 2-hydroxymuconic semialdehyde dehydrogenase [Sphingomonas sp. Root710]
MQEAPKIEPKRFRHFIAGNFVARGPCFDKLSPVDGAKIGEIHEGGAAEVDAAVIAAKQALSGPWGKMSASERALLLQKVAAEITRRFEDFVQAEMADTGQPRSMMEHAFIPRAAENFSMFADLIKNVSAESFMTPTPDGASALNYALRVPKGVIGVICPWNAPLLLMTWKVAPALACGNAVIVKPSEETPGTATLLAEVFAAVGVPNGVYNVVHGRGAGSAGEYLTKHPDVAAITFTGETTTGAAIMRSAADRIRDVSFELGGKNAGLIFADCDFDAAVDGIARATFINCGQVCLGTERLYVERPIFDRFVAALAAKAESLAVGPPGEQATTLGPLISGEHRRKVLSYYDRAVADGAIVVTGGHVPHVRDDLAGGFWVQPTIWTGLPKDSSVLREEIFGPCCHIAPFDSEEEAVERANDTEYGLATTIWTRDLSRAHRLAAKIDVGVAWVNSWFLRDLRTAFGGSKQSGIGREGGVHSLEFYTELRNVCVKL